jgi:hypothetical protein
VSAAQGFDSSARGQSPEHGAPFRAAGAVSASVPAVVSPILLTDEQAAALLGVSVRKFHELRPVLAVAAVQLGPRCVRYVRTELEAAVLTLPRQEKPEEPTQLQKARAKIDRIKAGGAA